MLRKSRVLVCLAAGLTLGLGFGQTGAAQTSRSATLRRPVTRAYLGVGVVDLTDDRVKALKLKDDNGVEVRLVDPQSPADKAGVKVNDVILEVNGKTVEDIDEFHVTIGESQPGSKVRLTIWRDGGKKTLSATLIQRPESFFSFGGPDLPDAPMPPMPQIPPSFPFPGFQSNAPLVGFEGETLSSQLAAFFGVKEGVLVRQVNGNTPAEKAGLKAGDVVVKVNGTPVASPREITGLVRTSGRKNVAFTVVRNKKEMTINVDMGGERQSSSDHQVL